MNPDGADRELSPLASYQQPLFKLEGANFALGPDGKPTTELARLYCFAVSDKRYALFNLDPDGRPIPRKASGHGLGHLRPPYEEKDAPASIPAPQIQLKDLGVPRWQHDLWYRIDKAALDGHPAQVELDDLPGLDAPTILSSLIPPNFSVTISRLSHGSRWGAGRVDKTVSGPLRVGQEATADAAATMGGRCWR